MSSMLFFDSPGQDPRPHARQRSLQFPNKLCPTHECFDDCGDYVHAAATGRDLPSFVIRNASLRESVERLGRADLPVVVAHGIGTVNGHRFAHGWIEHGGLCIEAFWLRGERVLCAQSKWEFLRMVDMQNVIRYSAKLFLEEWDRRGFTGPWDPAIAALTGGALRARKAQTS